MIENDLTQRSYRVMVGQARVDDGPPMHIHPHTDEGFYIADGMMVFVFPDREVAAGPNTSPNPWRREPSALARG